MWVYEDRVLGKVSMVAPPLPVLLEALLGGRWARTCLVQSRLLHQLEGGLVNTARVKTDRLAQLLLLPGLNLPERRAVTQYWSPLKPQILDPKLPSNPWPRNLK